ncbi:MAG TPA: Ig-like domain-containing protein [Gemmatimonadaceae bacterium]|nr:Ig-like domain-containing protein [Gemmatimonadaceae bacterium]
MRSSLLRLMLGAAVVAACGACGGGSDGTPPVVVAQVDVEPGTFELRLGTQTTAQLQATARTSAGTPVTGRPVTWRTQSDAVASVSSVGLVTAAGIGATRITATVDGVEGSAMVEVLNAAVASVLVSLGLGDIVVGESTTASALPRDGSGNALSGRDVTWSSADPGVASVSEDGVVLGVAAGATSIIATSEGVQGSTQILVSATPPNLALTNVMLSQSVQRADGTIPLVADGNPVLVNVYGTLDRPYGPGRPVPSVRIVLSGAGPEIVDERPLTGAVGSASDLERPIHQVVFNGTVAQPGLRVLVTINPGGALPEPDPADNVWPPGGQPRDVVVRAVPPLELHFVPILLSNGGTVGRVDDAVIPEYLYATRQMHPVSTVDPTIGAIMSTDVDFGSGEASAFVQILQQVDLRRVAEGSARYYVGSIRPPPGVTFVQFGGYAYVPSDPTSTASNTRSATVVGVGWFNRARHTTELVAHELAHTMGRRHAPCGGAGGPDPQYPHANASIGAYGHDLFTWSLAQSGTPLSYGPTGASDIMSYCTPAWVSDYTYQALLDARSGAVALQAGESAVTEPCECLIVWGSVEGDSIRLQPAFTLRTRAALPARGGSFRIEAERADGSRIFAHPFEPTEIDHAPGIRHFAFAVPLPAGEVEAIARVRVAGPARTAERIRPSEPAGAPGVSVDPGVTLSRDGAVGEGTVRWDARRSAAVLVRDAATGEVIAYGTRGRLRVPRGRGELEVLASDGVRTTARRLSAPR